MYSGSNLMNSDENLFYREKKSAFVHQKSKPFCLRIRSSLTSIFSNTSFQELKFLWKKSKNRLRQL
jgi:hypothetical protein